MPSCYRFILHQIIIFIIHMQLPLYDCNVRIRNSVIPAILKSRQHHDRKTTRLRLTTCEFSPVIIEAGCAVLSVRSLFPDAADHIRRAFLDMSSSTKWMCYNSAWRHDVRHLPRVRPPYHPLQCSEPIQRPRDLYTCNSRVVFDRHWCRVRAINSP